MLAFLSGLPIIGQILTALSSFFVNLYSAKLSAENTDEKTKADLAARELQVQQAEIQAQNQLKIAEIGRWYEPDHLFEYTLWVYFVYCIAYTLEGYPVPPIAGDAGQWASLIVAFMFGKRGIENVVRIMKR
jgi:hypothetical protein